MPEGSRLMHEGILLLTVPIRVHRTVDLLYVIFLFVLTVHSSDYDLYRLFDMLLCYHLIMIHVNTVYSSALMF